MVVALAGCSFFKRLVLVRVYMPIAAVFKYPFLFGRLNDK
jgi:hypothetical protein